MNKIKLATTALTFGSSIVLGYLALTASKSFWAVIESGNLPTFASMANTIGLTFTYAFGSGFLLMASLALFLKWGK